MKVFYDNTIIILTSDHGGLSNRGDNNRKLATSNLPLRAGKGWLYEGGLRVPLIITGTTIEDDEIETPVILTDLYPSILEWANLPLKKEQHLDGVSIEATLKNKNERTFIWHSPTARPYSTGDYLCSAIRIGDYKLIEYYRDNQVELFDIKNDIGEKKDISKENPSKTKELLEKLQTWKKENNIYQYYDNWVEKKFTRSEYYREINKN